MQLLTAFRDPDLKKAMLCYIRHLLLPYRMEEEQVEDWLFVWEKDHSCICRARGGSKTKDFVDWIVFRVLRTGEKWGWLAAKGGQLTQAYGYFLKNRFVKGTKTISINAVRRQYIELWSGDLILIGIISTSLLGLRLDGLVIDEEEDMEPQQSELIYPQLEGCFTNSWVGHMIHLGTLWVGKLFNQHVEQYPSRIRPWNKIKHLVEKGKIARIMADHAIPEWQKDMLYRCIPTSPSGLLFSREQIIETPRQEWIIPNSVVELYGVDFGGNDRCGGILLDPEQRRVWLLSEQEIDLERFPGALDMLRGKKVEAEGGGYNKDPKYGAKCSVLQQRIQAMVVQPSLKWKEERMTWAKRLTIYADQNLTPNMLKDIKSAVYDVDGYYLKDVAHPCHWLDVFFHALGANRRQYLDDDIINSELLKQERQRQLDYDRSRSKGL